MNVLKSIVRIVSNRRIGTGFVVTDDGLIVTCAHVLGTSRPEKVLVMFQGDGEQQEATVLTEGWRAVDAEDIALLRVNGTLPTGVQPLPFGSSSGTEGHPLVTFGYPDAGEVEGVRGTGIILGYGAKTRAGQLLLQLRSSEITEGFSGAPVWDEVRRRVVGMVVIAAQTDPLGKLGETAFATPTETLRAISPALQVSDVCPYRNLEAFTEADATFFRGRERVIEMLVDNLQNEPRFLAVFGASGSGKSSAVQAGLIPRLRNGAIPWSDRWDIIVTRPTDALFKQHLAHLDQAAASVALVIDQFEELFYDETASSEVMTQLTQLLEHAPRVTLLIVMRDDFYSLLMRQERLAMWLKGRVVNVWPTLKREEVESIVREPAELMGWHFEEGLVDTIVDDVLATSAKGRNKDESSTILPLLEFTLTQLWEGHQDGILTHEAYRRIGGVTGGLRQWADDAYSTFEERLQPLVRRIFTDLVHLGDEEQHIPDSRRRRPLSTLIHNDAEQADISQIIHRLVAARLLVTSLVTSQDQESKQEIVELIHDALLREWWLLKQWVEEDRRFLRWHQELERRTDAWVETNTADPAQRDPYKLFGGPDLTEAIEWLNTRTSDMRDDERMFIQASRERQEQEEQQKRRYTRRTVLVGLVGLGLAVGAAIASRQLFLGSTPPPVAPSLPLPYVYRGHTDFVKSVTWSPDGKRLATASSDTTVQVWDASSGQTLLTYRGHDGGVSSVAWSPDGKRLASVGRDVQVWDAGSGQTLLTYDRHTKTVEAVVWSPDSKRLATASLDSTVQIWDASSGQTLLTYKGHAHEVMSVVWSPDGKRLASTGLDSTVQIWDASSGQTLLTYKGHAAREVLSVAWSPDGKRLASGGEDQTVQIWDASSGQTLLTYKGSHDAVFVYSVAWSPDGKRLAFASSDTTVRVWDASSGQTLFTYNGHTDVVLSVAWSPDGKRLASAGSDKTAQEWAPSIKSGSTILIYRGHHDSLYSVAWSPDGKRLASASNDKTVQVWDASSGQTLLTYRGHSNRVWKVAWSPDGKRLASIGDEEKTVQVWDASSGQTLLTYRGHDEAVVPLYSVAWSPDGKRLASAGAYTTVHVWDASSGQTLFTYRDIAFSVAWSPDGKRLASANSILDASNGQLLLSYNGTTGDVNSVAWSPDGKRLASAGSRDVQVWDASSGQTLLTYHGHHNNSASSVAWSPDGKRLASASVDVQVWDASGGQTLLTYKGHTDSVSSVAWSPDGKWLASAGVDKTVQVWLWLRG